MRHGNQHTIQVLIPVKSPQPYTRGISSHTISRTGEIHNFCMHPCTIRTIQLQRKRNTSKDELNCVELLIKCEIPLESLTFQNARCKRMSLSYRCEVQQWAMYWTQGNRDKPDTSGPLAADTVTHLLQFTRQPESAGLVLFSLITCCTLLVNTRPTAYTL